MIFQLAVTFFAWLALMWVSINLVGILVRSLVSKFAIDKMATDGEDFIKKLAKEHQDMERKTNITALVLVIAFLGALYYFWSVRVVIIAVIIMVARIPDLLLEMRYGRQSMRMPAIPILTIIIMFATLPFLYYALYP